MAGARHTSAAPSVFLRARDERVAGLATDRETLAQLAHREQAKATRRDKCLPLVHWGREEEILVSRYAVFSGKWMSRIAVLQPAAVERQLLLTSRSGIVDQARRVCFRPS